MDDMSNFKEEFLSEAMDEIESMNEILLKLESNPNEERDEKINSIFRSAHTLKGNANAMNLKKFAELAHSIESLLSNVRNNQIKVSTSVMDVLFEACDSLEDGLGIIDNDGNDYNFDTSEILKKLQNFTPETINPNEDHSVEEHIALDDDDWKKINSATASNKNVFRVIGVFDATCKIKFAKALLLLRELSNISEIMKSKPPEDNIKTGKLGNGVEFVIFTDKPKDSIKEVVQGLSGFDHIEVLKLDAKYDKEKLKKIDFEHKEIQKKSISEKNSSDVTKQIQGVKVSIERLDRLLNLVGELLINNMRIQNLARKFDSKDLIETVESLNRLINETQEEVMSQRMIPIGAIFSRFPRMVRDLSKKENKSVNLVIKGEEIEFDRTVLDQIGDPLVHLIRNCIDHGIETRDERRKIGKEETGSISLIATRKKNSAVIEIIDDGVGIDTDKVKNKALDMKIITHDESEKMSKFEIQKLVFHPGLSTSETVTSVSGRGVGMDVVERTVRSLGGHVKIRSDKGKGTKVSLELPLTLAIVHALLVKVGKENYAIQLNQIDRVAKIKSKDIKTIQGHESFVLENIDIPLVHMRKEFNLNAAEGNESHTVVIVEKDSEKIGLIVDKIISQQQVLIKPLEEFIKGTKGIAGATILGEGDIGLIIDVGSFF